MMLLENKVALVTGAASGLGKQIATTFVQAGAQVGFADLNIEGANQAITVLDNPEQGLAINMDVTHEQQVEEGVQQLIDRFGQVDILVSNAGVQHIAPIHRLSYDDWKRMLAIHLDGAFLTTKACLNFMYQQGNGGSIIYMGSVHSKEVSPLKAPYITAKHGLLGLCKLVAKEGAEHGVRANVICPGFVRTPLVDKQIPEQARDLGISEEEVIKNVLLGKTVDGEFTTADDIAQLALFFASYPNNALTGQSLIASHGWFME